MIRLVFSLCYIALVVYVIVDVVQSDDEDRGGLPKILWIVLVILLPLIGSIAWLVVSRRARGRRAAAYRPGFPADIVPPAQYPRRGRTWDGTGGTRDLPTDTGPTEDDPEYRWLMEQARKKREAEQRDARTAPDAPDAPGGSGESGETDERRERDDDAATG